MVPFVIALTLPACSLKPGAVTPSTVGVVTAIEPRSTADPIYQLRDGSAYDSEGAKPLLGGAPFVGELLVAGGSGNDRWYYALRTNEGDAGCPFLMSDGDAWEEPDALVFEMGLRLVKADGYVRPRPIREIYDHSLFCVNKGGQVTGTP